MSRQNIDKCEQIWDSLHEKGYDPGESRIYLKEAKAPRETVTGRMPPSDTWYFSDGQHRLTALIAMGYRELRAGWWGVKVISSPYRALETTQVYIDQELCSESDFCDFARWRYDVPQDIDNVRALFEWGMDNQVAQWWEEYLRGYWGEVING